MSTVPSVTPISWQSRIVHLLVRARMRPHAHAPIDPSWVRTEMGRPRAARRWMARSTGAAMESRPAGEGWPGGEVVSWPGHEPGAPVLLYLHGGGYIACSPETHRPLVSSLVRRLRGRAFVPRYRLAPEHPFPAALHDAMAAYRYLLDIEHIAPTQIVIAGDSAGGGLALALALAIRDEQWPHPAGLVAFCPWTDLAATGGSLEENTERCAMFAGETIRRAARFYVGDADPTLPLISPLYGDYRGLPPMLVHASEDEVLRDDAIRVAEAARRDGVEVELQLWPHVPHVWQFFAAVLPEARASLAATTRFVLARM
ncbi:alpha/beta hydrolase [Gemmatimonas groenlandica]|uniref:Alpha/beta hydrolase n=1 Tax=Gemmatimonas groenlandica TaxID=2732249 RepID=A0A6M4IJ44_9BACT|nr:alpha/beta hydrolase [Gemmatimonas groenlandica]QJR34640.1 alpha/beta hydrolase [Gemmatimonas groenlandica]